MAFLKNLDITIFYLPFCEYVNYIMWIISGAVDLYLGSNLGSKSPPKSRCQFPIFLDTKPQLVNIAKKGHLFQFDDHFQSVFINGHKFQTNFGQWHSPIVFYVGGIEFRSKTCAFFGLSNSQIMFPLPLSSKIHVLSSISPKLFWIRPILINRF